MCMAGDALVATVPPPALVPSALDNSRKKNLALLQAAMKYAPNLWMFQRYQAVALVLKGYHYAEVSAIIGRSLATESHYVQAYRRRGRIMPVFTTRSRIPNTEDALALDSLVPPRHGLKSKARGAFFIL